jgi:hypothetical protein
MGLLEAEAIDNRLVATITAKEVPDPVVLEFVPESETAFFGPREGMEATVMWADDGAVRGLSLGPYEFEKVE